MKNLTLFNCLDSQVCEYPPRRKEARFAARSLSLSLFVPFLLTLLLLSAPAAWSKQYCGDIITVDNECELAGGKRVKPRFAVSMELIDGKYTITVTAQDEDFEMAKSKSWKAETTCGDIENANNRWVLSNSNKTATIQFDCVPYKNWSGNEFLLNFRYFKQGSSWEEIEWKKKWNEIFTSGTPDWGKCPTGYAYFVNTDNWETVDAHYWGGSSPSPTSFPGVTLTRIATNTDDQGVYQVHYGNNSGLLFNGGDNTKQTENLNPVEGDGRFWNRYDRQWYRATDWYLCGIGDWSTTAAANKMSAWDGASPTVVTLQKELAANTTYEFKIYNTIDNFGDTHWRGNDGTIETTIPIQANTGWEMKPEAGNCHLKTTYDGIYTFKYDFTCNRLFVDYPAASQCSGTGLRHFNNVEGELIDYTIEYNDEENQIDVIVRTTEGDKDITFMQVIWDVPGLASGVTVSTITDGVAKATVKPASMPANRTVYMRIEYNVTGHAGNWVTAENVAATNPQVIKYHWGECPPVPAETDAPCMNAIAAGDITPAATSATIAVSADDGAMPAPVKFQVSASADFASFTEYTAADGKITVTGLNPCTSYTYYICAKDRSGNLSTGNTDPDCRYKSVTFTTTAQAGNLALGKPVTVGSTIEGEAASITDGDTGTSWRANQGTPSGWWAYVDLQTKSYVNKVRIFWNDAGALPVRYALYGSNDASDWVFINEYTSVPANDAWKEYPFTEAAFRYIKIAATEANGGYAIRINELEVYGSGECFAEMDPPTMVSAAVVSVTPNSVTLAVSGTDANNNPTQYFVVNGTTYMATDGRITVTGLTSCTEYDLTVSTIDKNGTSSTANATEANRTKIAPAKTSSLAAGTNLAFGKTATVGNTKEGQVSYLTDGDETGTPGSWLSGGNADQWWCQVDLGAVYYINKFRLYWANVRPIVYGFYGSRDGSNWFLISHYTTAPANNDTWENYEVVEVPCRYVKFQATEVIEPENGIRIGEFAVYGTGECFEPIDGNPTMVSAEVVTAGSTSTSLTLAVVGKDANNQNVNQFIIDGVPYVANDGKITLTGLRPCGVYSFDVYCRDKAGNVSSNSVAVTDAQTTAPAANTNLAAGAAVYAGFHEGDLVKQNINDGNNRTRWGARFRPTSEEDWVAIDLGGIYDIRQIEVAWETGTSINYEFKSALTAEFGTQMLRAVDDDGRTIGDPIECDKIVSGNFSTFEHKSDQPTSAANTAKNDKGVDSDNRAWDIYTYTEPIRARYIKLESGLNADYPSSFWEIHIYGDCGEMTHKPIMQWAEVVSLKDDAAELYVSALDVETAEKDMKYEVEVISGDGSAGTYQMTGIYTFNPGDFELGQTGHIVIGGLLPEVYYTVHVYAIDEDNNKSENHKTITFTTTTDAGCSFASTQAYNVQRSGSAGNISTQMFQKGYNVNIESVDGGFVVTASTADNFKELTNAYVQRLISDPDHPATSGIQEYGMTAVPEKERTFISSVIPITSGVVKFFVKFQFAAGGICLTQPITYDAGKGCTPSFIIYHHDDKPMSTSTTTYEGGTLHQPIAYYRHFSYGIWEDITLPFEVDSVEVYDPEDHRYYTITATYMEGETKHLGNYLLRTQQDHVSGAEFVDSWQYATTPVPQKNQPYAVRFTSEYYAAKYIIFRGSGQTIDATLTTPTNIPTEPDQYQVYGNNTMKYCNIQGGKAYLVNADHSDEIYRLTESSAQVRPFETYVLAAQETMRVMRSIGPWRGSPTSLEDIEVSLTEQPLVAVYTIGGVCVGKWTNVSVQDVIDQCAVYLPAGCYIVHAGEQTTKIVLK